MVRREAATFRPYRRAPRQSEHGLRPLMGIRIRCAVPFRLSSLVLWVWLSDRNFDGVWLQDDPFDISVDQLALTYKFRNAKPKPEDIFDASFLPAAASRKFN